MSLIKCGYGLEHKTSDISAAERLQLMKFDYRLIIQKRRSIFTHMVIFRCIINFELRNINPLLGKSIFRNVGIMYCRNSN